MIRAIEIGTFSKTLHKHGFRLTPQREIVLKILRQSKVHLDAEGIWQLAKKQDASVNLATVYRTLHVLVEIGLIQQSYLGEGQKRAYYETVAKPQHYHFACLSCDRVMELESERINQAQLELESRNGVQIFYTHLKFEGLCPECASANDGDTSA